MHAEQNKDSWKIFVTNRIVARKLAALATFEHTCRPDNFR